MPTSIEEIKKSENALELKEKIYQILEEYKEYGLKLDEIEFNLKLKCESTFNFGGKLFLYNLLQDLVKQSKIKTLISKGTEYFFID